MDIFIYIQYLYQLLTVACNSYTQTMQPSGEIKSKIDKVIIHLSKISSPGAKTVIRERVESSMILMINISTQMVIFTILFRN